MTRAIAIPDERRVAPEEALDAGVAADAAKPLEPSATPDAGSPTVPVARPFDCSTLPAAPVVYEELHGFASSEDFVFDAAGNYVGVDDQDNLVRISRSGEKQLWAPAIGDTAGMASLPDGSIVFCDTQAGALKRVHPNGSVAVVLGGLAYPNGLDIGPDGFIYVAENNASRVRRVNPDTGEFSVVAVGLDNPNGVAFGPDPGLLYVGSFGASGVYVVELGAPGALGRARVFARPNGSTLAEPVSLCPDQQPGSACVLEPFLAAECQTFANVVDCAAVDPCPGLPDGSACDHPVYGACASGRCVTPCDALVAGAACNDPFVGAGVCEDQGGELSCNMPDLCEGSSMGDYCEFPDFGSDTGRTITGTCEGFDGFLFCTLPNVCLGRPSGETCDDPFFGAGACEELDGDILCLPGNPCEGRIAGDPCEDSSGAAGRCVADAEQLVCAISNTCDVLGEGAPCEDPFFLGEGVCHQGACISARPGGIDGLGVDVCGNVYATEFQHGIVWRISPEGEIERLVTLPSSWIPNMKWGRGLGGFATHVLYVTDRYQARLFALPVGVAGAPDFFSTAP